MIGKVPDSWARIIAPVLASAEVQRLGAWLETEEWAGKEIYPPRAERLRALELTAPDAVKVVILGQDPYHGPGQAHGLSFSVPDGVRPPPSLANIYRELHTDIGLALPSQGNLENWAKAGVLLLNNTLTVERARAGGHARRGWEAITDAVVAAVAARAEPSVFILWGNHAQAKAARIPALASALAGGGNHLLIRSVHPSPLSAYRGFFGSRPFSRTNEFLEARGRGAIDWRV